MPLTGELQRVRPLRAAVEALGSVAPTAGRRAQKAFWRSAYDFWGARGYGFYAGDAAAAFLNYGYAPLDGAPDHAAFGEALYHRVAGARDLTGKDVLEVGCGRGSGAAAVFAAQKPRRMVGIDLAGTSVARARADHARPNLEFLQGDAEALPLVDSSFDAVLNVESSHCYPDVARFLREAARVLRPGGLLLLADLRYARDQEGGFVQIGHVAELREHLAACPLEVVEEEDITANVARALTLDSPRRRALIEREAPRMLRSMAFLVAGVAGTPLHDDWVSGDLRYLRFVAQKPESP